MFFLLFAPAAPSRRSRAEVEPADRQLAVETDAFGSGWSVHEGAAFVTVPNYRGMLRDPTLIVDSLQPFIFTSLGLNEIMIPNESSPSIALLDFADSAAKARISFNMLLASSFALRFFT
jgi:hypothetical protein